jgi:hypothetical protein
MRSARSGKHNAGRVGGELVVLGIFQTISVRKTSCLSNTLRGWLEVCLICEYFAAEEEGRRTSDPSKDRSSEDGCREMEELVRRPLTIIAKKPRAALRSGTRRVCQL